MFLGQRPDASWWLVRLTRENRHDPVVLPHEPRPSRPRTREQVWRAEAKVQKLAAVLGVLFLLLIGGSYAVLDERPGFDVFEAVMVGFAAYAIYSTLRALSRWRRLSSDLRALDGP